MTKVILTPFPEGEMPEGVKRWDDGPPFGRIELHVSKDDRDAFDALAGEHESAIVYDANSRAYFRVRRVPCGLGCVCAASAQWRR